MRANITKRGNSYEITSAMRPGGRRKPRSRTIALTDCVCYDRNGNEIRRIERTATVKRNTRNNTPRNIQPTRIVDPYTNDIALMARMGTIHSQE